MPPAAYILTALLAPLLGAVACLPLRGKPALAAALAVAASGSAAVSGVVLCSATAGGEVVAVHAGGWTAPFGIVLVADAFASLMLTVCALVVLAAVVFCHYSLPARYSRRHLYPLVLTLALGTNGAFLTGDLFNLYVWFEVLLLSSFALIAMLQGRAGRAAAWRYVVVNLVSSLLFLVAAGLIYGKTGTLNFAELRLRFLADDSAFLIGSSAALLFAAFGIKAALVPLAFWLPASYPVLPPALAGLFAGILTKVGLYAFYRVFGMVFSAGATFPHREVLLWIAIATMVGGVLGAVAQGDMRRILSFHIISQVGYMALALALFTPAALAAGIFYLAHHIIVKANLFFATGLVEEHAGSSDLSRVSGVVTGAPLLAVLFAVPALSLAGLPPLSGFFAKFALLRASLEATGWAAAFAVALVGLLTVFSMLKIWRSVFWGVPSGGDARPRIPLVSVSATLAVVTVAVGLASGPLVGFAATAASGLLDPTAYTAAVLPQNSQ